MMLKVISLGVLLTLVLSYSAKGLSGLPTSIYLSEVRSSTCFVWEDPFSVDEKKLAETENYPVQTTFFAKKASSSNCAERHHFQIFYRARIKASSDNVFKSALTPAFCRKKAKSFISNNALPNYVYAAKVGNKNIGFYSACLMAGSVRMGSKSKTYYFEELFESRIRRVSN